MINVLGALISINFKLLPFRNSSSAGVDGDSRCDWWRVFFFFLLDANSAAARLSLAFANKVRCGSKLWGSIFIGTKRPRREKCLCFGKGGLDPLLNVKAKWILKFKSRKLTRPVATIR